jgi:hypothetical protein
MCLSTDVSTSKACGPPKNQGNICFRPRAHKQCASSQEMLLLKLEETVINWQLTSWTFRACTYICGGVQRMHCGQVLVDNLQVVDLQWSALASVQKVFTPDIRFSLQNIKDKSVKMWITSCSSCRASQVNGVWSSSRRPPKLAGEV